MTRPASSPDRHGPRELTSTDQAPTTADAALGDGPPTERNAMPTDPIDSTTTDTHNADSARGRRRWARLIAGLAATTVCAVVGLAPAGSAQSGSRIRLAHFSPDAPVMDVYLVGFDGEERRVLNGLGFGQVSDYTTLEPGNYTFLLRRVGSPADSDPWVTASAELMDGSAYTFAAMGPRTDVTQVLVADDLAPPPAGQAKVRLIQASTSAGEVDVSAGGGWVLAEAAAFGSTTDYAAIAAGPQTIEVTSADGARVPSEVNFEPGTVNTVVVVESTGTQAFEVKSLVDATGVDASAAPVGGIATGVGGSADTVDNRGGLGAPILTGLALSLAATVVAIGARHAWTGAPLPLSGRRVGRHFTADRLRPDATSPRRSM
jgi:Domain of unknown function (DUF4397)